MENKIYGSGGKDEQYVPVEAANSLYSHAVGKIVDVLSEGEISGLVDGGRSIFLDGTPLLNEKGEENFKGVKFEQRFGLPDQPPVSGLNEITTPTDEHAKTIKFDDPKVFYIDRKDFDSAKLTITTPRLFKTTDKGDVLENAVTISIEVMYEDNSDYYEVINDTIKGKTMSPYQRVYKVALEKERGERVYFRISRSDEEDEKSRNQNTVEFTAVELVTEHQFSMPDTAYMYFEADSAVFGHKVPSRAYEVRGLKVLTASNYDAEEKLHNGIWDGSFKLQYTNNPAYCYLDLLTSTRYGMGVELKYIDKFSILEAAKYCDELVQGESGPEPRFQLNTLIRTQKDAQRLLGELAAVFRGMTYFIGGKLFCTFDGPRNPVKLFSPSNIIDGDINYEGTSKTAQHNCISVGWVNPARGYEKSYETAQDSLSISKYGMIRLEAEALGAQTRGQAQRLARWILETQKQGENIAFSTSIENMVMPGEIITVSDPNHPDSANTTAGKILKCELHDSNARITLDREASLEYGENNKLVVETLQGTFESLNINYEFSSCTNSILVEKPENEIMNGAQFTLLTRKSKPRDYRVVSVAETDKHIITINAIQYDENKYERIEQGKVVSPEEDSPIALSAPSNINVDESFYKQSNKIHTRATISWFCTDPKAAMFGIRYKHEDGSWSEEIKTRTHSIDIDNLRPGNYTFNICSIGIGLRSIAVEKNVDIEGKYHTPDRVDDFKATAFATGIQLDWKPLESLDIVGYSIKRGASWENAEEVVSRFVGNSFFIPLNDTKSTYFLIRAINEAGFLSPVTMTQTEVSVTRPDDVESFNITSQNESLFFSWTKTNGAENYEVRQGSEWNESILLFQTDSNNKSFLLPGDKKQVFCIKAVSRLGLYSESERVATVQLNENNARKEIFRISCQESNWPGIKKNLTISSDNYLELDGSEGSYEFNVTLNDLSNARCAIDVEYLCIRDDKTTWQEETLTWEEMERKWLPTGGIAGISVETFIKTDDSDEYIPFRVSDHSFKSASILVKISALPNISGKASITKCDFRSNIPQATQVGDLEVSKEGVNVVFEKPFHLPPHVQVSFLEGETFAIPKVSNISKNAFTVEMIDLKTSQPVDCKISWCATGF